MKTVIIDGEEIWYGLKNGNPNWAGGQNTNVIRFHVKYKGEYFTPYDGHLRVHHLQLENLLEMCKTKEDVELLMNELKR